MKITIDGKSCTAEYGEFILDIAKRNNIHIPSLCHSDALPGQASCRLCVVEIVEGGRSKIVTSCVYPVTSEIEVITNSVKILTMRKTIIMLLSARAPNSMYLHELMEEYGVPRVQRFTSDQAEKCILCGLCARACETVGLSAISTVNRGITKRVSTPYDEPSPACIGCGSCAQICPTGVIQILEEEGSRTIWNKKFDLLDCQNCGKHFITREQFEYVGTKLETASNEQLCDSCKKSRIPERLKAIYGVISR